MKTSTAELVLGGITQFTTIDFPGRMAAVFFTRGCTWRCRYCHNSHLHSFRGEAIPFEKALRFLDKRGGLLDGVVFSGGEPTAQRGLAEAMQEVRDRGFQVGLHTTGMFPGQLESVLGLCDWVGMDVKAPFRSYDAVTGRPASVFGPRESVGLLVKSGVEHEFRTTVHPILHSEEAILEMASDLKKRGARRYVLQKFRAAGCGDGELNRYPIPADYPSKALRKKLESLFASFEVRE